MLSQGLTGEEVGRPTSETWALYCKFIAGARMRIGTFSSNGDAVEATENLVLFLNNEHAAHKTGKMFERRIVNDNVYEVVVKMMYNGGKSKGGLYCVLSIGRLTS